MRDVGGFGPDGMVQRTSGEWVKIEEATNDEIIDDACRRYRAAKAYILEREDRRRAGDER